MSGWSRLRLRRDCGISLEPAQSGPLPSPAGMRPWEPWPLVFAAEAFLAKLMALRNTALAMEALEEGRCWKRPNDRHPTASIPIQPLRLDAEEPTDQLECHLTMARQELRTPVEVETGPGRSATTKR